MLATELMAIGWEAGLTVGIALGLSLPLLRILVCGLAAAVTASDDRRNRIAAARARAVVRRVNRAICHDRPHVPA